MPIDDALSNVTIGELLGIFAIIAIVYTFSKNILTPLMQKWFKIDKNAKALDELAGLPSRVAVLEQKSLNDHNRLNNIDEVNVLLMQALRSLLQKAGADEKPESEIRKVGERIDGFLVGKGVRS